MKTGAWNEEGRIWAGDRTWLDDGQLDRCRQGGRVVQKFALLVLLMMAMPVAGAHHGFTARFDSSRMLTLNGAVAGVNWVNPHVLLQVRVQEEGGVRVWIVELGSISNLTRQGYAQERWAVGTPVVLEAAPLRAEAALDYPGAPQDTRDVAYIMRIIQVGAQ